ncbi:MAG: hypothetical protein QW540_10200 [Archaeoglobaceae archaeon]
MDRRAYKIRNSNFYNFLAKQAVYAISSYAEILKLQQLGKEKEIDDVKQFLNGLILESVTSISFSRILDKLEEKISLIDIDKVLRVDNRIVAVFEFKHCKNGRIWIKKHSLETLQTIAKALNCKVLLISRFDDKWLIKDITNDKVFRDFKNYYLNDFLVFENDEKFVEFLRKLIGGQ